MTEGGSGVLTTELREVFDMFGWKKSELPDPCEDYLLNSFIVEHEGRLVKFVTRCAGGTQTCSYIAWSLDPNDGADAERRFLSLLKKGCLAYTNRGLVDDHASEWHIPKFENVDELRMKMMVNGNGNAVPGVRRFR